MNKCARNGCPHPQAQNPLHLCHHHWNAYQKGTIFHTTTPHTKQIPTHQAQLIIQQLKKPNESWRQFQKRTGIPKDTARTILTLERDHIKTKTWETIKEAQARLTYKENTWPSHHKESKAPPNFATTGQKAKASPNGQPHPTPGQPS